MYWKSLPELQGLLNNTLAQQQAAINRGADVGMVGLRGSGRSEYYSPQRQFLDRMRQREPEAYDDFRAKHQGYNVNTMLMQELEYRFKRCIERTRGLRSRYPDREPGYFAGFDLAVRHTPVKPKTWFEEIQAEVDEWLKEVS